MCIRDRLWEALAGRHPFWGVPLQEVARAIEAGAPPLLAERRDLPRRLVAAVDGALAPSPERRPRASALASDLRNAIRKDAPRQARCRPQTNTLAATGRRELVRRFAPVALAAVSAALGATLLPFWPPALVVAITLVAALAAWRMPRVGLAVALATPVFPLGNVAESAAVLYGLLALGWLALSWRDARWGLLFVTGPLLAPLGLLALMPLAAQPARGVVRRGAQAVLAVLAAAVVAGVARNELPLTGAPAEGFAVSPQDSVREIATGLWQAALLDPVLLSGAVCLGLAAATLPWIRRRSRYGVLALGIALLAGSVAVGVGLAATVLVALVWAFAAAVSAGTRQ